MKQIILFNWVLLLTWQSQAQPNSYTPLPGVIESSLFTTSHDGKESPFFITSNITIDSTYFIELVFTLQMSLSEQIQELRGGLFKNALRSVDSNKLQYLYIRHLANAGELSGEINSSYFSRFKRNPQDSLKQRLETFLKKSSIFKNINDILLSHHLKIEGTAVMNPKIISSPNKIKNNKEDREQQEIDAEIFFYLTPQNSSL